MVSTTTSSAMLLTVFFDICAALAERHRQRAVTPLPVSGLEGGSTPSRYTKLHVGDPDGDGSCLQNSDSGFDSLRPCHGGVVEFWETRLS